MPDSLPHGTRLLDKGFELLFQSDDGRAGLGELRDGHGEANRALDVRRRQVDPWLVVAGAYLDVAAICYGRKER